MKNLKVSLAVFLSSFLISFATFVYFWTLPESTTVVYPIDLSDPSRKPLRSLEQRYYQLSQSDKKQVDCLATNMYHEAKNQGYYGMKAVGLVTMNRANHSRFPSSLCGVVYQKKDNVCQFSWYCSRKKLTLNKDSREYKIAQDLAVRLYTERHEVVDVTVGALFFHADYVNPRWNRSMVRTTQIGNHIFYTM